MVLGRAHQPPETRPMDLACHHLDTIGIKKDNGDQASDTGGVRYDFPTLLLS